MKEEFSDFQLGLTGEYDYKGPYTYVDGENDGVLRIRIACAAFALLIAAAYVVAGLSGAQGATRIYVMIPYIALAIPVAFMIAGLFYAIPFARKMTPIQFKRGFARMKKASWFALGLEILCELIEIFFTALEHLMRVGFEHRAVHERAGVALVGVAYHIFFFALGVARGLPLKPRRKARAAAPREAGDLYRLDDGLGRHLRERLFQRLIPARGEI